MIVQRRIGGLSLVDAVVLIAVVLVAVALLLPAIDNARDAERERRLGENYRRIGVSVLVYTDTYRVFPTTSDPGDAPQPEADEEEPTQQDRNQQPSAQ